MRNWRKTFSERKPIKLIKRSIYRSNNWTYKTMNFSRYFALMLVEAAKSGKDEHLRKVQSDVLAKLKNSKNKNWMSITAWALISLFIVGWIGFNYFYGPRLGLPDWFWLTAKTLRGLVKKRKTTFKPNWSYP